MISEEAEGDSGGLAGGRAEHDAKTPGKAAIPSSAVTTAWRDTLTRLLERLRGEGGNRVPVRDSFFGQIPVLALLDSGKTEALRDTRLLEGRRGEGGDLFTEQQRVKGLLF